MARKNRSIAGFDQVAGDNTNTNNNTNDNTNIETSNNVNTNINRDTNNDALDQLLHVEEKDRVMKGIYLDRDIAEVLSNQGKGKGRKASMSDIVNLVLREKFEEKGGL